MPPPPQPDAPGETALQAATSLEGFARELLTQPAGNVLARMPRVLQHVQGALEAACGAHDAGVGSAGLEAALAALDPEVAALSSLLSAPDPAALAEHFALVLAPGFRALAGAPAGLPARLPAAAKQAPVNAGMAPVLPENRAALAERFPELLRQLESLPAEASGAAFGWAGTQPGGAVAVKTGAYSFFPYGTRAPRALAAFWASRLGELDRTLVVTPGFGTGLHVQALLDRAPRTTCVLVVEPDPVLLRRVLASVAVPELLRHARLFLATPATCAATLSRMNLELSWVDRAQAAPYAPLGQRQEGVFERASRQALELATQRWTQINTDVRRTADVQANTYRNLATLFAAPEVTALGGAFGGATLVLIGAGPSLDEALDFLKAARPHALLVAANTAYRKLLRAGIRPHLTVAVDPKETTALGYRGCDTSGVFLAAAFPVYPEVPTLFPGRTFAVPGVAPLLSLLRPPGTPVPALIGEGTVTVTAVNIGLLAGCTRVCYVGQDFALAADGRSHASDTHYEDQNANFVPSERHVPVPGNTTEKVPTEPRLVGYLRAMEALVAGCSGRIQFLNTARTGARIAGVPYAEHGAALEWVRQGVAHDFEGILTRHARSGPEADWREPVTRLHGQFDGLLREILPGLSETEAWLVANAAGTEPPPPEILQALGRVEARIAAAGPVANLATEGRGKRYFFECARRRPDRPTQTHPARLALLDRLEFAWAVADGAAFHLQAATAALGESR